MSNLLTREQGLSQSTAALWGHSKKSKSNITEAVKPYAQVTFKVPPLFALCCVRIFGLNQLYCSVKMQLWEALSCLFIEQAV